MVAAPQRQTRQRAAIADLLSRTDHFRTASQIHGETAYRRCSIGHHHHLVCRYCGRTVEVEGPAIERWTDHVADQHGFSDVQHHLEIFGRCSSCAHQITAASGP